MGFLQLAFLALILLVIPAVLTFSAYLGGLCILTGFLYFKDRAEERPSQSSATELYSAEEKSALRSMLAKQERVRKKKERLFVEAVELGLVTRSSDQSRFDARNSEAKRTNAELDRLDEKFATLENQIWELKSQVSSRYGAWLERSEKARFFSSGHFGFRGALWTYLVVAASLAVISPTWLQNFSYFVEHHMWFQRPELVGLYGALVLAFWCSAAIGALGWLIKFHQLESSLLGEAEFQELWIPKEQAEVFEQGYGRTEAENVERDDEFADNYMGVDEQGGAGATGVEERAWYELLEVEPGATDEEIKAAYREQIKKCHPDHVANLDHEFQELADRKTKALNAAYEEGLRRS